jgi:3,4-dihydroxy 2-butanone 4-phosphate synthase/GTP cyclohydrolase II
MRDIQFRQKVEPPKLPGDTIKHLRTYGIGAQILCDLGVRKMRVMSAPTSLHGISGFNLEVTEYVGRD